MNNLFGLSETELLCYKFMLSHHPVNGYQISLDSGIPRSRIYDILRSLKRKGLVSEVEKGKYVPLPAEETLKRIEEQVEGKLNRLKKELIQPVEKIDYEYVWTLEGHEKVIDKAREMISASEKEIYMRLYLEEAYRLVDELGAAVSRGVEIKSIAMDRPLLDLEMQLVHPRSEELVSILGGRSFDLVVDRAEALVGLFHSGQEDISPINWAKNHWFVYAAREGLRHDFYHCILARVFESGSTPSQAERRIYEYISNDL